MKITSSYILSRLDLTGRFKTTGSKAELQQLVGAIIVESRILNPNISVTFNQIRFPNKKKFSVYFQLDSLDKILIFIR